MAVQTEQVPHHIVIIGGGAGGLELATQLGDSLGKSKQAKITRSKPHPHLETLTPRNCGRYTQPKC